MDTPTYPSDLCHTEHERSALMAEGLYLISRECWGEGFAERFEPVPRGERGE